MKKLIFIPLLLSFVFCRAQTKFKIIKYGACFKNELGYYYKANNSPVKNLNGEIFVSENNIVSIYVDFYGTVDPWDKFFIVNKTEGNENSYITTWKGISIIGGGFVSKPANTPNVLMSIDRSSSSEIVIYVGSPQSAMGTFYICKGN